MFLEEGEFILMNSLTEKLNALNGRVKANTSFVDKKKKGKESGSSRKHKKAIQERNGLDMKQMKLRHDFEQFLRDRTKRLQYKFVLGGVY